VVDVAASSGDLAIVEQDRTITYLALKPLRQAALALGAPGPSPNRLGILGKELNDARKRPPPSVDPLLATLMALLVLVGCRPAGLTSPDRIRITVRRRVNGGRLTRRGVRFRVGQRTATQTGSRTGLAVPPSARSNGKRCTTPRATPGVAKPNHLDRHRNGILADTDRHRSDQRVPRADMGEGGSDGRRNLGVSQMPVLLDLRLGENSSLLFLELGVCQHACSM
jgi:hypothetical protein